MTRRAARVLVSAAPTDLERAFQVMPVAHLGYHVMRAVVDRS